MTNVAIIPARGGSKGVKRKNIRLLADKPLIAYTIEAALDSKCFDKILVSSEDQEILEISEHFGAKPLIRPDFLATDTASSLDVIEHALQSSQVSYDTFCLLQPTSPLRTSKHIKDAYQVIYDHGISSVISVSHADHHPLKMLIMDKKGKYQPIRSLGDLTSPRQALPKAVSPNGALYICRTENFLTTHNLFHEDSFFYEMSKEESIDIDTEQDFTEAQQLLNNM